MRLRCERDKWCRGATWNAGTPAKLLEGRYFTGANTRIIPNLQGGFFWTYDVSADGQRFVMIKATDSAATATPPSIIVVQHFDEELKRLVPAK